MRVLNDAARDALSQLCDAWVLAASATLALHGYGIHHRDQNLVDADSALAETIEAFRETCLHGAASFRSVVLLDALEDLIFSARGFEPFVDMPSGARFVRSDDSTLTRSAALHLVRLEAALWEDARPRLVPVPLSSAMVVSRLDAFAREVDRIVDGAIQASREQVPDELRAALTSAVRARIENALRSDARLVAEVCARVGRVVGYLAEQAARERAESEPHEGDGPDAAPHGGDGLERDDVARFEVNVGSNTSPRKSP